MNAPVDVAIIGAGPAGCAAAIRARQARLRVVVLEANPAPKAVPGETLHPGILPLFKQLGLLEQVLAAGFRRHRGIWLAQKGCRTFLPYGADAEGEWLGLQVDRRDLQQLLQQAVIDNQAEFLRHTQPEAVSLAANRVKGIVINGESLPATWTIDATGRTAWLAQQLQIPVERRSPPLSALFGWEAQENPTLEGQPLFAFRADGWDWQAPVNNNRTAWVKLRIGEISKPAPAGMDVTWRLRPLAAGPGYFLLGDTAAMLDPASSHGVLRALMSGILCGFFAEAQRHHQCDEVDIIRTYRAWLRTRFEEDERRLRQYYVDSPAGKCFGGG
jgi:flavin-dependent dehydrogenase